MRKLISRTFYVCDEFNVKIQNKCSIDIQGLVAVLNALISIISTTILLVTELARPKSSPCSNQR